MNHSDDLFKMQVLILVELGKGPRICIIKKLSLRLLVWNHAFQGFRLSNIEIKLHQAVGRVGVLKSGLVPDFRMLGRVGRTQSPEGK